MFIDKAQDLLVETRHRLRPYDLALTAALRRVSGFAVVRRLLSCEELAKSGMARLQMRVR